MLQNEECDQKSDHPLEASPYFKNVCNGFHELILIPDYLY